MSDKLPPSDPLELLSDVNIEEMRSPNWSTPTKIFVAALFVILLGWALSQFSSLIAPLVIAGILAYILNPLIVMLDEHTPLQRAAAIALVYGVFALVVLGVITAAGVTIYQQTGGLIDVTQEIIRSGPEQFQEMINEPIAVGPWTFRLSQLEIDLADIWQQLASAVQPALSQSAQFVTYAASTTASSIGWAILVFVLSIYFAIDLPRFGNIISDAIYQPGYREDVRRLLSETGRVWNGYLRGQTILATMMAVIFTVVLWLLGVRYALVLGLLAGILDFIPFVGAFITVTLSTAVAIFQGDNWLGLSPMWYGLLVLSVGLILQQIEGNWLNPRIVGGALGLHPLLVMIGAIMGSTLAGILGVMLAAPVMATVMLLTTYAWRKMFDLDPFPASIEAIEAEPPPVSEPEPALAPTSDPPRSAEQKSTVDA